MRKFILAVCLVSAGGCASPAASYVKAEAHAWAEFDPFLDRWVDAEPSLTAEQKDALHQLNVGRRARVSRGLAGAGQ